MVTTRTILLAALCAAATGPALAQEPEEGRRIAAGAALAEAWCAECHALAPDAMETTATTDAAPPMGRLARLDDDALRAFLSQPHPPMPPLILANDEIDDLIAFIGTLRPGGEAR